jgi:SulP family sulfate permease
MAYASIGGFNPVVGLYSGVVPRIVASIFARTVLMVTTLTSAIALSSRSVLKDAGLGPGDAANVAALALVVGAVMLIFGLLKFGAVMNFVSNAVMTGISTGIAVQIIAGVLGDATGYNPSSGNTIGKFIDSFAHIGRWHPAAAAVAAGTVAAWMMFHLVKPLRIICGTAGAGGGDGRRRDRAHRRRDRWRHRLDRECASPGDGSELRRHARPACRRGGGGARRAETDR